MSAGEKRLARLLERKLDEDYLLWYDVPVGPKQLHPDFLILHPARGLLVLEVKDWKPGSLLEANPEDVTLVLPGGNKVLKNPLKQARDYAIAAKQLLERDAALVWPEGHSRAGKLIFPFGWGAVFTNITGTQFEATDLQEVFDPRLVLLKDDLLEQMDEEEFQKRLWDMFPYQFASSLECEQIDRVRWHFFPQLRIHTRQLSLLDALESVEDDEKLQPVTIDRELIRIMDLQQEQLARSLGSGHRVIHGVAGSGKTLVLVYRCRFLAQVPSKPLLVLCFNVSLASKLRRAILEEKSTAPVVVRHFHGWCVDLLKAHRVPLPEREHFTGAAYVEELVARTVRAVESGQIASGSYGAVMIDEGHDFEPAWLKLTVQMVDPRTESLLVLYDDAQNLYGGNRLNFSFSAVGVQARGRTTILRVNYRNTAEVLAVAREFVREVVLGDVAPEEDVPMTVNPESAGRHGPLPELVRLPHLVGEVGCVVEKVQQLHAEGLRWKEMAVVYRSRWLGEKFLLGLRQAEVPVEWVNADSRSRDYDPEADSVKLVTMHSSKGLEFPAVFVPGVGYMPAEDADPEEEARLLYVAMTRAVDRLVITYHRESDFTRRLSVVLGKVESEEREGSAGRGRTR